MVWVDFHENEASRATEHNIMAFFRDNLVSGPSFLMEDDTPGSSLNGRDPNRLKNSELKF